MRVVYAAANWANITKTSLATMHQRFGHPSFERLKHLYKDQMVEGMELTDTTVVLCVDCVVGKQKTTPYPRGGGTRTSRVLGLVHMDMCTHISKTEAVGGYTSFLVI